MQSDYLLSIIVPTHNRGSYIESTVKSLLRIKGNVEVIVSDSSTSDVVKELLSEYIDAKLINYVKPGVGVSIVDNFNYALKKSCGEYVLFIGDDDFVSDKIIGVAKWASRENLDSVSFAFSTYYNWPDFFSLKSGQNQSGKLVVGDFTGLITKVDSVLTLRDSLKHPGYGVMNMPRLYLGMVSRDLINRIQVGGDVFGGVSPDIYSASLISQYCRSAMKIDYPVIIPGSSGNSGSGKSASGRHVGALTGNEYMGAFKRLVWNNCIPAFYSVESVWGFSLFESVKNTRFEKDFLFERLVLKCTYRHPKYIKYSTVASLNVIKKKGVLMFIIGCCEGLYHESVWGLKKVALKIMLMFFKKFKKSDARIYVALNTDEAYGLLKKSLEDSFVKLELK